MLDHRPARRGVYIIIVFFFQRMWRMICSNYIYPIVQQCLQQSIFVLLAFYGRIPLYFGSFFFIIGIGEPQMMDTDFRSYFLLRQWFFIAEEVCFLFRGHMKNMKSRARLLCKFYGPR